jgi:hypothetical protein
MTPNKELVVSDERRPVHPQEPAEGAEEHADAPGAERVGDLSNPEAADGPAEEERSAHPEEPAEGGKDQGDND